MHDGNMMHLFAVPPLIDIKVSRYIGTVLKHCRITGKAASEGPDG